MKTKPQKPKAKLPDGKKISQPEPDIRLTKVSRDDAVAAWHWELMREVMAWEAFAQWRENRARAKGCFSVKPFGTNYIMKQMGAKAYDLAFGTLGWLLESNDDPKPLRHGAWCDLSKEGKEFFRSFVCRRASRVVELKSPGDLQAAQGTHFTCGDWHKPETFNEQLMRFLRDSGARGTATVIFAAVDEGASIAEAKRAFGAEIKRIRKSKGAYAKHVQECQRLLRGLHFHRLEMEHKANKKGPLSKSGTLAYGVQEAAKLSTRGAGIFTELRDAARIEAKKLETALRSVTPVVA